MKRLFLATAFLFLASGVEAQVTRSVAESNLVGLGMSPQLATEVAALGTGNGVIPNNTYLYARNAAGTANISVLKVDATDDTILNSDASDTIKLQIGGDANRLFTFDSSADAAQSITWGDAGTTATQILTVSASTSDADDDSSLRITAGGGWATDGTRGSGILLAGEEVSGGGDLVLYSGASDEININIGSTTEFAFQNDQLTVSGAAFEIVPGATSITFRNNADSASNFSIADAGAITFRDTLIGTGTSTLGWAVVAGANTACTTTCTAPCVFGVNTAATEADIVACSDATADECLCAGAS